MDSLLAQTDKILLKISNTDDYKEKSDLYFDLWCLYSEAENKQRAFDYRRESYKYELLQMKKDGLFDQVRISASVGCSQCAVYHDKKSKIEEAIIESILPLKQCPFTTCNAIYFPVI